jgi:hypothetical protein
LNRRKPRRAYRAAFFICPEGTMKITDGKNTIKAGLPNMRQATFYAYNDPGCQAAGELHIVPEAEAAPKGGKAEAKGENPAQAEK